MAGRKILTGLDSVDWENLHHAYGTAKDVPKLIRLLASQNAGDREAATDGLFGNIYHQGTIYEATSYAIPFLYDLLQINRIADKSGIVSLIGPVVRVAAATGLGYLSKKPSNKVIDSIVENAAAISKLQAWPATSDYDTVFDLLNWIPTMLNYIDGKERYAVCSAICDIGPSAKTA